MNELIEKIFEDFEINGEAIPVKFMRYEEHGEPYVTYQQIDCESSLSADDELIGYVEYYDFDIYSKGNYTKIIDEIKKILKKYDFVWQPSRSSTDMYETDTGYYHKTLNFAILKEE